VETPAPRRALALAALAATAVLAAGCGSDSGSESSATVTWAGGVCTAISTWTEDLRTAADELTSARSTEGLQAAVGDVKDATTAFVDDLGALGAPDTEAGTQAKATLDRLGDELNASVQQIEDAVNGISGLAGLTTAVSTVTQAASSMGTSVQTAFSELESLDAKGELEDAFKDADSCDELTAGSS
jgi:hypothetical protein